MKLDMLQCVCVARLQLPFDLGHQQLACDGRWLDGAEL